MTPSSAEISEMFSEISPKYDLANRILSFGIDKLWRKRLIKAAELQSENHVLDLATGTADLVHDFDKQEKQLSILGLDLSRGMLEVGRSKLEQNQAHTRSLLVEGDALQLPCKPGSFDVVSIAFGLRNLVDRGAGIAEMARVLRAGGRLLILEFSLPRFTLWRAIYRTYLKYLLPLIGGLITGSRTAYEYLHDSICEFPSPNQVEAMMRQAGFEDIKIAKLAGGIAVLYIGDKR